MLADHYKHTVTVSRSVVTGNKTNYAPVTSFPCHIQPVSESYGSDELQRPGKAFKMFSTVETRIGDRITDQNSAKYEVTGMKHHQFRGHTHYESMLRGV